MVSIYDAVISSYECNDRALADAWAIAEHQRQEDLMKNITKLYAALLVDDNKSNVKRGYLTLHSGDHLTLIDEETRKYSYITLGAIWMVYVVLQLGKYCQGSNYLKRQRNYSGGLQTNIHPLANHGNGGSAE